MNVVCLRQVYTHPPSSPLFTLSLTFLLSCSHSYFEDPRILLSFLMRFPGKCFGTHTRTHTQLISRPDSLLCNFLCTLIRVCVVCAKERRNLFPLRICRLSSACGTFFAVTFCDFAVLTFYAFPHCLVSFFCLFPPLPSASLLYHLHSALYAFSLSLSVAVATSASGIVVV